MSKSIRASRKYVRKARPPEQGFNVGVRLQPHHLSMLDRWIAQQPKAISRPEAMRQLMMLGVAETMLNGKRKK